jgi:hypothetical protein
VGAISEQTLSTDAERVAERKNARGSGSGRGVRIDVGEGEAQALVADALKGKAKARAIQRATPVELGQLLLLRRERRLASRFPLHDQRPLLRHLLVQALGLGWQAGLLSSELLQLRTHLVDAQPLVPCPLLKRLLRSGNLFDIVTQLLNIFCEARKRCTRT